MGIWWESITDRGPLTPDILRDTNATEDILVHQQCHHTAHPDTPAEGEKQSSPHLGRARLEFTSQVTSRSLYGAEA